MLTLVATSLITPDEGGVTDAEDQLDARIAELEVSMQWRVDATAAVRELFEEVPARPEAEDRRVRLLLMDVSGLIVDRGPAKAVTLVLGLRDEAITRGHRGLQARAEWALSNLFRAIGDPGATREHAVAALALDDDSLDPVLRCRLRMSTALAACVSGAYDEARRLHTEAFEIARALPTPWLSMTVLNDWAYAELLGGCPETAGGLAAQLQITAHEQHVRLKHVEATTVAEILHARGRSDEAVAMLRDQLSDGCPEAVLTTASTWLALALVELEVGDLVAAGRSLDTAEGLATTHALQGMGVEAMGVRAALLAAQGDYAGAYETYRRFHDETLTLRSEASDARAQTLHAMLQVDHARRESTRYRELSYRDPLTGLLNRRQVDEELDRRLARAAGTAGQSLAVAMVDLDHFKRVNDTWSHAAGDAVLVRLAVLLEAAAADTPGAWAARLGGEEFLLVLPGLDLDCAREIAETLRRRIADDDWSGIAPGVPVTASIGVAATSGAPTRADLLRKADEHLYFAKANGRNRVEPSSGAHNV